MAWNVRYEAASVAVRRYEELFAWQLAEAFSEEVHRLIRMSDHASQNFKFSNQILEAARGPSKHITEGFLRFSPGEFMRFLDYALGSLGETLGHLDDGIKRGYFAPPDIIPAVRLAKRCFKASVRLKQSQQRYLEQLKMRRDQQRQQNRNKKRASQKN